MDSEPTPKTRRTFLKQVAGVGFLALNQQEKKETAPKNINHLFGISSHAWWIDGNPQEYIKHFKELKTDRIRIALDWKRFETVEGNYNFSIYDHVLPLLHKAGIKITGNFVTVPPWATSNPEVAAKNQTDSDLPPHREAQLRSAIREIVSRYPFIDRWEVWNEPEMWRSFGQRDANDYLRVLRAFYEEAKAINPKIQVAAATLTGWNDFLSKLYDIAPDKPWDAVTFHPYAEGARDGKIDPRNLSPDDPGTDLRTREIDNIHEQMTVRGDGYKPIWITEYGWNRPPAEQSRLFKATIKWMSTRPWIEEADIHMLHDANDEGTPQEYGLTIMTPFSNTVNVQTQLVPKQPFYNEFKNQPRAL